MWLTGPHRKWVVLGSFTPHLYSGTLLSYPFGLKILLTLTLGSRDYFLPESPSFQMITWFTRRCWRYSPINSWDPMCPSPLQFPATDKFVWITTYAFRSSIQSQWLLLLQDTPKYSPMFRESFVPAVLQRLFTPRIIPHACRGSVHPPLIMRFPKCLEILSVLLRIHLQPTACGDSSYLLALWLIPYV